MLKRLVAFLLVLLLGSADAFAASSALSNLSAGNPVSSGDLFYDVQTAGSGGVKVTGAQLSTFILAGFGAGGTMLTSKTEISSSQILNLATTPVQLVAAPSSGFYIAVVSVTYVLHYGSAPYVDGQAGAYYGANTTYAADSGDAGTPTQTADWITGASGFAVGGVADFSQPLSSIAGQAVDYTINNGAYTGGNGSMTVIVAYLLIPVT
jgi:hypothetical protein